MPMPLMTDTPLNDEHSSDRGAISERVRAHRARRAKLYGRDRNTVELDDTVTAEAQAFQARVQQGMRDAS